MNKNKRSVENVLAKRWEVRIVASVIASKQREGVKKGLDRIYLLRDKKGRMADALSKSYPNYEWYVEEGPKCNMPPDEYLRAFITKDFIYLSDKRQRRLCPKCGYPNIVEGSYCNSCGVNIYEILLPKKPSPRFPCPKCGYKNYVGNYNCDKCGLEIREWGAPPPTVEDPSKTWHVEVCANVEDTSDKKKAVKKGLNGIFSLLEKDRILADALSKAYPGYEWYTVKGPNYKMTPNETMQAFISTHDTPRPLHCSNCQHVNYWNFNKICDNCGSKLEEPRSVMKDIKGALQFGHRHPAEMEDHGWAGEGKREG